MLQRKIKQGGSGARRQRMRTLLIQGHHGETSRNTADEVVCARCSQILSFMAQYNYGKIHGQTQKLTF